MNQKKYKAMKNLTKTEKIQAIKRVYEAIAVNSRHGMYKLRKIQDVRRTLYSWCDMRTRVGRYAIEYFNNLVSDGFKLEDYGLKWQERFNRRIVKLHPTKSFRENKLFVDYREHKKEFKCVERDRLNFNGRYHYARTEQDFKVLEIIRKHNGTK